MLSASWGPLCLAFPGLCMFFPCFRTRKFFVLLASVWIISWLVLGKWLNLCFHFSLKLRQWLSPYPALSIEQIGRCEKLQPVCSVGETMV